MQRRCTVSGFPRCRRVPPPAVAASAGDDDVRCRPRGPSPASGDEVVSGQVVGGAAVLAVGVLADRLVSEA